MGEFGTYKSGLTSEEIFLLGRNAACDFSCMSVIMYSSMSRIFLPWNVLGGICSLAM